MSAEKKKTFDRETYDRLVAAVDRLPKEAVEVTKAQQTRKGYDTTGYQYQFLVNVLNEEVAPEGWTFSYRVVREMDGSYKSGDKCHDVTAEVTIDILGTTRTCVGSHVSRSYGDALKGAITNAFKKTLAFMGPGKRAYEGTLDDDYLPAAPPSAIESVTVTCERCHKVRIHTDQAERRRKSCGYAVCGECYDAYLKSREKAAEPPKFEPPKGGAAGGGEFTGNRPPVTETMRAIRGAATTDEVEKLMKEVKEAGRFSDSQMKLIRPCAEKRYAELAKKLEKRES